MTVFVFSLPILIVSILQGIAFGAKVVFDRQIQRSKLFNSSFVFAVLLVFYNWTMQSDAHNTVLEALFFVVLSAYYGTMQLERFFVSKIQFTAGFISNLVLFSLVYLVLERVQLSRVEDQLLILSLILLMFYIISGVLGIIQDHNTQKVWDRLLVSSVFTALMISVLLFSNTAYIGLFSINLFFVGLIAEDFIDHFLFASKREDDVAEYSDLEKMLLMFETMGLSDKQLEVIKQFAEGNDIQATADALDLSKNAIETRLSRIYKKTPYKSLPALTAAIARSTKAKS